MNARQRAIEAGDRYYFTGRPCSKGHVDLRRVVSSVCSECHRQQMRQSYQRNKPKRIQTQADYYSRNSAVIVERVKQWVEANRGKSNSYKSRNKAKRRTAQPVWVDARELRAVYEEAESLTKSTGHVHSVDHIVPLRRRLVCGLHVPWNLQVMPLADNIRKGNKWKDEQ